MQVIYELGQCKEYGANDCHTCLTGHSETQSEWKAQWKRAGRKYYNYQINNREKRAEKNETSACPTDAYYAMVFIIIVHDNSYILQNLYISKASNWCVVFCTTANVDATQMN